MEEALRELYNEQLDFIIDLANKARLCLNSDDPDQFRETLRVVTRIAEGLLWESGETAVDLREEKWSHLAPPS